MSGGGVGIQTVSPETNPNYYDLLKAFEFDGWTFGREEHGYEEARSALNGRVFRDDAPLGQGADEIVPETPASRLVVRGWSAMIEEMVLSWIDDPRGVTRQQLLDIMAGSLPAVVEVSVPSAPA